MNQISLDMIYATTSIDFGGFAGICGSRMPRLTSRSHYLQKSNQVHFFFCSDPVAALMIFLGESECDAEYTFSASMKFPFIKAS